MGTVRIQWGPVYKVLNTVPETWNMSEVSSPLDDMEACSLMLQVSRGRMTRLTELTRVGEL